MVSRRTGDRCIFGRVLAVIEPRQFRCGCRPLGGQGWIIGPDGEVLGMTSSEQPFVTVDIDLSLADRAKDTYPRYVF